MFPSLYEWLQIFKGEAKIIEGNTDDIFVLKNSTSPSEVDWLYLSIRLDKPDLLIDGEVYALKVGCKDSH